MIQRIMPRARLHVALSKERTTLLQELKSRVSGLPDVRVSGLTPRYPQGLTELLSRSLLNRELPPGGRGADVGVVTLGPATVLHAYEAVAEGKPVIDRIVALSGAGFNKNLHARIRVGTPLKTLLKDRTNRGVHRLVRNSVLTGETITNPLTPVDRTFSQIISVPEGNKRQPLSFLNPGLATDSHSRAFLSSILRTVKKPDTNLRGELRPCIQCGACAKVCPARLEPAFLSRLMRRGVDERLTRYGLLRCMDCNLCSYVCPCKIPVATQLKQAKETLLV